MPTAKNATSAPASRKGASLRIDPPDAFNPLAAGGLLRLPQVLALVGVSKSTWWKLVKEGRAPQAVKLGDRCTAWRAADIAAFIENAGQIEVQA